MKNFSQYDVLFFVCNISECSFLKKKYYCNNFYNEEFSHKLLNKVWRKTIENQFNDKFRFSNLEMNKSINCHKDRASRSEMSSEHNAHNNREIMTWQT